ncbi:MAG: seryl-tRNA synthetase [Fusobacteria bacterium]|nr:MAG: seryl-tRNA synthetase [Fusobacteriota bacterium]KAF0229041.1 MAG: seryl-tRNA [Fusobacteriota bacterium]
MLDIRLILEDRLKIEDNLARRGLNVDLSNIVYLEEERKAKLQLTEEKKSIRNQVSKDIGRRKANGENPEAIMEEMRILGDEISEIDILIRDIELKLRDELLRLPNLVDESIPVGVDESANVEVKKVGEIPTFNFTPKDHQDLGVALDIMDFERANKVAGPKFVFMKGLGARLERALMNFMLDYHGSRGYKEVFSPFLANEDSFYGTGQLPKFGEDMYKIEDYGFFLIPTAEVPLTNMYRDEIIKEQDLPIKLCGFTPCFRSEAGSAGRDTKGLIRMHQFSKVEMVQFVKPKNGEAALEELVESAGGILSALGLAYRVVVLSTGDIGFGAAKTYDLEVYLPSYEGYKEISSCSLYTDFQSRRSRIRYRNENGKNQLVYTLNGSGLAIGRTIAAIVENYQQADGTVRVPEALVPYLGVDIIG